MRNDDFRASHCVSHCASHSFTGKTIADYLSIEVINISHFSFFYYYNSPN